MGNHSVGREDIRSLSGAGTGKHVGITPFVIRGFHSDNGSEFGNHIVAQLLNKLLIRFTKLRPRHTDDNGLVETKNGSVLSKNLGYVYIPQACAKAPPG